MKPRIATVPSRSSIAEHLEEIMAREVGPAIIALLGGGPVARISTGEVQVTLAFAFEDLRAAVSRKDEPEYVKAARTIAACAALLLLARRLDPGGLTP